MVTIDKTDEEVVEATRFLRGELDRLEGMLERRVVVDKFGTIIEGTLKDSDIGPACLAWLKEHASEAYQMVTSTFSDIYDLSLSEVDESFWNTDEGWFLHEVVFPTMHEQVPDGYYFGAHPGDGSDIGFHLEAIDEEVVCST